MKPNRCKRRRPPQEPCCESRPRFLLPRVLDALREHIRCLPVCLEVTGLPCGLCGPFTLLSVEADGNNVQILPQADSCCGPCAQSAQARIPLLVRVCDGCGCQYCGAAEVCVPVRAPRGDGCSAFGGSLTAIGGVRLAGGCGAACEPVFSVRLEVWVDVYLIRMEPCGHGEPPPPKPRPNPCPPPSQGPRPFPPPPPFPAPGPFVPWR